jgi:uncharacterized spore protein YtfJ
MNELLIGNIIKIAGVTIIPVESINIYRETNTKTHWWYGSKTPYALVICTSTGIQVLDHNAQEMNVSDLISNVPQLADILRHD